MLAVSFRQKFLKPRSESFIRVRHQHYQGEDHPASRKVDISFKLADVPLSSDKARHKFALLAGPRLNHLTGEVKIASERFPTEQMNEKWCSDILERMVKEAEVSTATVHVVNVVSPKWARQRSRRQADEGFVWQDSADAMSDIPVDTRSTLSRQAKKGSAGKRVTLKDFPKEWLSTPQAEAPSAGVGKQGGAEKVKP